MEISFHSHLDSNTLIATKFCTWHDNCAVVACATICCDLVASNGITARWSFHRIWIAGKKSLVKRAPERQTLEPSGCSQSSGFISSNFFSLVWVNPALSGFLWDQVIRRCLFKTLKVTLLSNDSGFCCTSLMLSLAELTMFSLIKPL